jgi:rsbT co-antagonist protein RsbR
MEPAHLEPPTLDAAAKAALREYWDFYYPLADELGVEAMSHLGSVPELAALLSSMRPEQQRQQQERSMAFQRAALIDGDWSSYLTDLDTQGAIYARMGLGFSVWFQLVGIFRTLLRGRLVDLAKKDPAKAAAIADGMNLLLDIAMARIGEAYLSAKEETIKSQQEAIRELSTPVLQIRDQILILPIVGVMDTHRARLLTQSMLDAIRDRRARAVVMDVTGVPIVDSKVANHLAQACEAARLMGAVVVMTGISQEIAQTLVTIGAELPGVRTLGDLQSGIEAVEHSIRTGLPA